MSGVGSLGNMMRPNGRASSNFGFNSLPAGQFHASGHSRSDAHIVEMDLSESEDVEIRNARTSGASNDQSPSNQSRGLSPLIVDYLKNNQEKVPQGLFRSRFHPEMITNGKWINRSEREVTVEQHKIEKDRFVTVAKENESDPVVLMAGEKQYLTLFNYTPFTIWRDQGDGLLRPAVFKIMPNKKKESELLKSKFPIRMILKEIEQHEKDVEPNGKKRKADGKQQVSSSQMQTHRSLKEHHHEEPSLCAAETIRIQSATVSSVTPSASVNQVYVSTPKGSSEHQAQPKQITQTLPDHSRSIPSFGTGISSLEGQHGNSQNTVESRYGHRAASGHTIAPPAPTHTKTEFHFHGSIRRDPLPLSECSSTEYLLLQIEAAGILDPNVLVFKLSTSLPRSVVKKKTGEYDEIELADVLEAIVQEKPATIDVMSTLVWRHWCTTLRRRGRERRDC
ncbi:MAG: hypothetical protein Q9160_008519 [Pyrenula sp. 1 TL-2023]